MFYENMAWQAANGSVCGSLQHEWNGIWITSEKEPLIHHSTLRIIVNAGHYSPLDHRLFRDDVVVLSFGVN